MQRTRALYRAIGLDPTKTRPSSEALLRRVRRGDTLPRVNTIVDLCNWCSVETQIAFGVYDRDRIAGEALALRLGAEGEGYDGIRKDRVNVAGRLTLVDADGPVRQPDLGLAAHVGVGGDDARPVRPVRAGGDAAPPTARARCR